MNNFLESMLSKNTIFEKPNFVFSKNNDLVNK